MLYHEFSPQSIGVKAALDREVWSRRPAIADLFRKALHDGGATLPAIISGFWRLSRGDGRLNIHDFFRYRLFQPSFTEAERRAFISDSISWTICDRCSNPHWRAATEDKWLNSSLLKQCNLICPDILHVFDPSQRSYGNTPVSRNVEEFVPASQERFPLDD